MEDPLTEFTLSKVEGLGMTMYVIPAKAGIQSINYYLIDGRLRDSKQYLNNGRGQDNKNKLYY